MLIYVCIYFIVFALRTAVYFLCMFYNSSKWGGKSSISIHGNMLCVLLSASFYYISIKLV